MLETLRTPTGQAILMTGVLAVMILVGVYVMTRFRDFADDDVPTTADHLTNFQELRDQGDISDVEFRKLRTVLDTKLQRELNDNGDTG
jgi:hypothetical protein